MNIAKFARRLLLPVAAMAVSLTVAAVAQAQTVSDIVKKGKVTIGVISGAPPFGITDAEGNPAGYDVDVANLVAKYMGVPAEIVPLTAPSRIPALESGKVDFLVATLAPSPERAKVVMFTMPYSAFEMSIFAPVSVPYKNLQDLKGKKVGVTRGTTQDSALTRLALPGTDIVRFEDDATTAQALISNQVEAVALPETTGQAIVKARAQGKIDSKFSFSLQPNSMTVRKDAFELHQWLNNVIYFIKVSGELDAISRKWTNNPLPELPVF